MDFILIQLEKYIGNIYMHLFPSKSVSNFFLEFFLEIKEFSVRCCMTKLCEINIFIF